MNIQDQPTSRTAYQDKALAIFQERNKLAEQSAQVDPIEIYDPAVKGRREMTEDDILSADLRNASQLARCHGESGSSYSTSFNPFESLMTSSNSQKGIWIAKGVQWDGYSPIPQTMVIEGPLSASESSFRAGHGSARL